MIKNVLFCFQGAKVHIFGQLAASQAKNVKKKLQKRLAVTKKRLTFAPAMPRRDGGMVDTRDLKSLGQKWLCGFESRSRHPLR